MWFWMVKALKRIWTAFIFCLAINTRITIPPSITPNRIAQAWSYTRECSADTRGQCSTGRLLCAKTRKKRTRGKRTKICCSPKALMWIRNHNWKSAPMMWSARTEPPLGSWNRNRCSIWKAVVSMRRLLAGWWPVASYRKSSTASLRTTCARSCRRWWRM